MDSVFIYTPKPEDLTRLLTMLPTVEAPTGKADSAFIKSLGFTASSSKYLYNILKSLGFMDDSDNATDIWKDYLKNECRGQVFALRIKEVYYELFEKVMCPYLEGDESILEFFKINSKASDKELLLMLETFRILNDFADYSELLDGDAFPGLLPPAKVEEKLPQIKVDPNLQVNIQVLIDPNTPDEKIETIFKNMRKYLLGKEN
jgi:hypothetical protein